MEGIYISDNELNKILVGAFQGLGNLIYLDLSNNYIESFGESTFNHLPQLKCVYLSHNKISLLHDKIFEKNIQLKVVTLNENQLRSLSNTVFSKLINLTYLTLRGNKCVNHNWESEAFKNIYDIENKLMTCKKKDVHAASNRISNLNQKFEEIASKAKKVIELHEKSQTECSKQIEEIYSKMDEKIEKISIKLDAKYEKFTNEMKELVQNEKEKFCEVPI